MSKYWPKKSDNPTTPSCGCFRSGASFGCTDFADLIGGLTARSGNHRPGVFDYLVKPPIKSGR
jgi:hypothetical protein